MVDIYEGRGVADYFKLGDSISKVLSCVQFNVDLFGPAILVNSAVAPPVPKENSACKQSTNHQPFPLYIMLEESGLKMKFDPHF